MDTSDSEYFESADEDFDHDFDSNVSNDSPRIRKESNSQPTIEKTTIPDEVNDLTEAQSVASDAVNKNETVKPIDKVLEENAVVESDAIVDETVKSDDDVLEEAHSVECDNSQHTKNVSFNASFLNKTEDEVLKLSEELDGWDSWGETEAEKLSHTVGGNVEHRVSRTANDMEKERKMNVEINIQIGDGNAPADDWDAMWGETQGGLLDEYKEIQPQTQSRLQNIQSNDEKTDDLNWGDDWTDDDKWMDNPNTEWKNAENPDEIAPLLDKLSVKNDGWSDWGNWGVSSLITTATEGVQTLTSTVSQGLSNALETGIGVPSPEELVQIQRKQSDKNDEPKQSVETPRENSTFVSMLTGVTKLVESTGSKVVHTGLDTLETIGKKTMEVLQDGDPGLVKKRALLGLTDKPVLSQMLREAKEKAEEEDATKPKRKVHFETLFDDHHGLVHLEALEMLSRQCDMKLEAITERATDASMARDLHETILQVKELCELPDDEDELDYATIKQTIEKSVTELHVPVNFDKLFELWTERLESAELTNAEAIHEVAIDTLAKMTAIIVEQFHRIAEMLMVKERRSTADEADSLVQLTSVFISLVDVVAGKYSEKLNATNEADATTKNVELNALITNVFFEATNSSTYVQDAFQLLIPILQIGAV